MATKKVFVTRVFPAIGVELLKKAGLEVTAWDKECPMTQEELIEQAQKQDALFCTVSDKIDKYFLNECSNLKIVSQFAVGYDNIDIQEATKLGIAVGFAPGAMTDATADTAFALMLATSRKMCFNHKKIINGEWGFFNPIGNLGVELKGKTLGVFGFGRIGYEVAKRCKGAYDMNIIYNDLNRNIKGEDDLGARYVEFNELLQESDIVTAHCVLSPETTEIFNKDAFEKMKPSAIFINTSRGGVHNETDLIEALQNGEIWGAGLDVTNPEPMAKDNALLSMENVVILPHIGSATVEARNAMATLAAENIIEYFKNGQVPHIVNPEVLQ